MNSEKIDWISECGVKREHRPGLFSRVRASLLKRKSRKARDVNELDPTGLVEKHNRVFGIDSREPTAAMRYDLRKKPPESTVDVGPLDFKPSEPENGKVVSTTGGVIIDSCAGVPTSTAVGDTVTGDFSTDAPIIPERKETPADPDDFFTGIGQKYHAPVMEEPEEFEEPAEEPVEIPVIPDESMSKEAEEFEDSKTEDIVQYVEAEIEARETRQMSIDDPRFEEEGECFSAEPVISRQEKLDVEFESPAYDGDVKADITAASASAEAVVDAIITNSISAPEETASLAAPAETAGIPAPEAVPVLGAPSETPAIAAPVSEVQAIGAPSEAAMIAAPVSSVSYVHARELNAANAAAGRYGASEESSFESQIAEVEASSADDAAKSVQVAQIIGGMLLAVQMHASAVAPVVEEAPAVEEITVAEETAEVPAEEPDMSVLFASAREKNVAYAEAGLYTISEASLLESQIAEVEASGATAEVASVQIAQLIGGMLLAAQMHASAAVEPEAAEPAEVPAEEPDMSGLFAYAREKNTFNAESGMYGSAEAENFECQISDIEASGASAESVSVQVAQVIGGMLLAAQMHANAVAVPVVEEVPVTVETAEEPVPAAEEAAEIPAEEPDMSGLFATARGRNALNVTSGKYGRQEASVFESQISEIEASEASYDVRSIQLAQVMGGMLIAAQIKANAVMPVPEPVPEVVETVEEAAEAEVPEPVIEAQEPVIELPPAEVAEVPVEAPVTDAPAEAPKTTGVSFRFGQTSYRSAVRGTVVRFVFGTATE